MNGAPANRVEEALAAQVHDGVRYVAFGDMTPADARVQAEKLAEVGTWGPLARAAKVGRAWNGLAAELDEHAAERVRDLDPGVVVTWAERVWAIAPAGGMI